MTLDKFIDLLLAVDHANVGAGDRDVIVVVAGQSVPWPDVTGITVNDDTIEVNAKVYPKP